MSRKEIRLKIKELLSSIEGIKVSFIPITKENLDNEQFPLAVLQYQEDRFPEGKDTKANSILKTNLVFQLTIFDRTIEGLENTLYELEKILILNDGGITYDGIRFEFATEGKQLLFVATLNLKKEYQIEYYHEPEEGVMKAEVVYQ